MLLTGGTGTPEPQTQMVESGKEATFTVNSKEPTRTNYDFKGWSTDKNATTASYHGGESIKNKQGYHPVRRVGKPQSQREPRAQQEPCSQRETRAYSYAYAEYTVGTRP